jgi:hypothetical protein
MSIDEIRERNVDGKLDKLVKAQERTSLGQRKNYQEDDVYTISTDKEGNGTAIIRFLPGLEIEEEPLYVETINHWFKGKGGQFYQEGCPTAMGSQCPVCDSSKMIVDRFGGNFKTIPEEWQKIIRNRSRGFSFYTNILVIHDPVHPDKIGHIFKYRFGKKILEKILAKAQPKFETDPVVNVFDYQEGANFKIIVKKVSGYPNYDDSSFDVVSPLSPQYIDFCKQRQFALLPYTNPARYKDYMLLRSILVNHIDGAQLAPIPDNLMTGTPVTSNPIATVGTPSGLMPLPGSPININTPPCDPMAGLPQLPPEQTPENSNPFPATSEAPPEIADIEEDNMDYFAKLAAGAVGV